VRIFYWKVNVGTWKKMADFSELQGDEVELLSEANIVQNLQEHLPELLPSTFDSKGRSFHLNYCTAAMLTPRLTLKMFQIFETNMKEHYEATWGWNRNEKMKELFHPASRFIIATKSSSEEDPNKQLASVDPSDVVAFTIYRFDWDDDDEPEHPVLYCYELHVDATSQKLGLGHLLMSLLVAAADKLKMWKVMLTCFKRNEAAMSFYRQCGFLVDSNSPSSCGHDEEDYEILSNKPLLK